jgi:hypothetical protein
MCRVYSTRSNAWLHVPFKINSARERLPRCFAPRIRALKFLSFRVCRFVTLEICPKAECLSVAIMDTFELVIVRLSNMLATII